MPRSFRYGLRKEIFFLFTLLFIPPAHAVSFDYAVSVVIGIEGGVNPDDPSKYGITQDTLDRTEIGPESVIHLTPFDAQRIYRKLYWTPVNGDTLPSGVDLAVFDMAVQFGVTRSVTALQRAVGVEPDGVMGPETIKALEPTQCSLIDDLHTRRAYTYARQSTLTKHWRGWYGRLLRIHDLALRACRTPAG